MNANTGDAPTAAEERRGDIRFFLFALLFYLFSLFAFAAAPLLAMPLGTAIFDRYYLPAIEKAIEEKYDKPPHAEEAPILSEESILSKHPRWEARDELFRAGKLLITDNETGELMTLDMETGEIAPLDEKYKAVFENELEASANAGEDPTNSEEKPDEQDAKEEKAD